MGSIDLLVAEIHVGAPELHVIVGRLVVTGGGIVLAECGVDVVFGSPYEFVGAA